MYFSPQTLKLGYGTDLDAQANFHHDISRNKNLSTRHSSLQIIFHHDRYRHKLFLTMIFLSLLPQHLLPPGADLPLG